MADPHKDEIKRIILETLTLEAIDRNNIPNNPDWVIYEAGCFKINTGKTVDNIYNYMKGASNETRKKN